MGGECRSPCAVLSCENATVTPNVQGESTSILESIGTLCSSAVEWATERSGRTVSAVIAQLYDQSGPLVDASPRVYDDATPNAIQCSTGDSECVLRVGN